jgi:hypothetical protein
MRKRQSLISIAICRVASIKASHAADNILLGDDLNAERDIRLAIDHIREAARSYREWQAINEAMADAQNAEAAQ